MRKSCAAWGRTSCELSVLTPSILLEWTQHDRGFEGNGLITSTTVSGWRKQGNLLRAHRNVISGNCDLLYSTPPSRMKIISSDLVGSNGPAFQSPNISRIASPERTITASMYSRDGNRSVLLVVRIPSGV